MKKRCATARNCFAAGSASVRRSTPAVLTNTRPEMRVNCMEIFGPVVTVEKFTQYDDALASINRSDFGLQAGVFTRDFVRITRAFETLEVGGLMIGEVPAFRIDHMPYGGVKDSGLGRGRLALCDRRDDRAAADGH